MMWLLQIIIAWLLDAQNINLLFGALCLAASFGAHPRAVTALSAVLYFLMGLV